MLGVARYFTVHVVKLNSNTQLAKCIGYIFFFNFLTKKRKSLIPKIT